MSGFSLISSNLLIFDYLGFLQKFLYIPYLFGTVPQSYLRSYILGLSLSKAPNKTQFSTFRLCIFFQSTEASPASNHLMLVTLVVMTKNHLQMLPNVPRGERREGKKIPKSPLVKNHYSTVFSP